MNTRPDQLSPSLLLQEYRDTVMKAALQPDEKDTARRADQLEAEISRRLAW